MLRSILHGGLLLGLLGCDSPISSNYTPPTDVGDGEITCVEPLQFFHDACSKQIGNTDDLGHPRYLNPTLLFGVPIYLKDPETVIGLGGLFSTGALNEGAQLSLSLYADHKGAPGAQIIAPIPLNNPQGSLIVETEPTTLDAGGYWLMIRTGTPQEDLWPFTAAGALQGSIDSIANPVAYMPLDKDAPMPTDLRGLTQVIIDAEYNLFLSVRTCDTP